MDDEIVKRPDPQPAARPEVTSADVLREFEKLVETASRSAERATGAIRDQLATGPAVALFIVGFAVIGVGLAMQIQINGEVWAVLKPGEFIAVLILGLCILLLGAAMPLIPQRELTKRQHEAVEFQRETLEQGARLAETVIRGTATERSLGAEKSENGDAALEVGRREHGG